MSKAALLYDADCGFCRWTAERIMRRDRKKALRAVPIQSAEGKELLGDMDEERRMATWHLVGEDGVVRSGGAAVAPLSRLLPGTKPVAILADLFPRNTDRLYRLVANNRERLGRMLGQKACAVDPGARDHAR